MADLPDECERSSAGPEINWKSRFLERLAESSNVSRSAKYAEIHPSRAYRARREDPEFANEWLGALREGYIHLELEVLRRLREGDLQTDSSDKFDFANAIRLLNAHRESVAKAEPAKRSVSATEVRCAIDRKVEEIRKRISDENAAEKPNA